MEDRIALEEEEEARQKARKIGPFAFLIEDDIDTEVLTVNICCPIYIPSEF